MEYSPPPPSPPGSKICKQCNKPHVLRNKCKINCRWKPWEHLSLGIQSLEYRICLDLHFSHMMLSHFSEEKKFSVSLQNKNMLQYIKFWSKKRTAKYILYQFTYQPCSNTIYIPARNLKVPFSKRNMLLFSNK